MKTAFSYNLLKHLRSKKAEGGFTLIELLVVIIIIGILAAIALPSFLNQANRARESEASNYIGAANRGQQAYFLEELAYAPTLPDLDVGIPDATDNYRYGNQSGTGATAGNFTVDTDNHAVLYAVPLKGSLKGFGGLVYTDKSVQSQDVFLCRAPDAGQDFADVVTTAGSAGCGTLDSLGSN